MSNLKPLLLVLLGFFAGVGVLSMIQGHPVQAQDSGAGVESLVSRLHADEVTIAALKAKTAPLSVFHKELTISGVNVHIVDGSGSTSDGTVDKEDKPVLGKRLTGLGNLIIGYNELGNLAGNTRSGSHNLIIGSQNNYSSFGGLVVGKGNRINSRYAAVSGGQINTASGPYASVSGGNGNIASGYNASVCGGECNLASGYTALAGGGTGNKATGGGALAVGGYGNLASDGSSSVTGGGLNTASGEGASVSGGNFNTANEVNASVSGGLGVRAASTNAWAAGSFKSP